MELLAKRRCGVGVDELGSAEGADLPTLLVDVAADLGADDDVVLAVARTAVLEEFAGVAGAEIEDARPALVGVEGEPDFDGDVFVD